MRVIPTPITETEESQTLKFLLKKVIEDCDFSMGNIFLKHTHKHTYTQIMYIFKVLNLEENINIYEYINSKNL